jgi:hypothetical protein
MFYGSARNRTILAALGEDIRLLSRATTDSVVFMRRRGDGWAFRVELYTLREQLGLTQEQLRLELENGSFYERIESDGRERLLAFAMESEAGPERFSEPFYVRSAGGESVPLRAWFDPVHDRDSGVEYIVVLRAADV